MHAVTVRGWALEVVCLDQREPRTVSAKVAVSQRAVVYNGNFKKLNKETGKLTVEKRLITRT